MNPEQKEKIQNLVKSSKVLTPMEREEWLALLDLMNDKQLFELQKILGSTVKPMASTVTLKLPKVFLDDKPISSFQAPKLSHILNVPSLGGSAKQERVMAKIKKTGAVQAKQGAVPGKKTFLNKLKSVFSKKELKEGHPEFELELPAKVPSPPKKLAVVKQKQEEQPSFSKETRHQLPKEPSKKEEQKQESFRQIKEDHKRIVGEEVSSQVKKEKPVPPKPFTLGAGGGFQAPLQNIVAQNVNLNLEKGSSALIYSQKGVKKVVGGEGGDLDPVRKEPEEKGGKSDINSFKPAGVADVKDSLENKEVFGEEEEYEPIREGGSIVDSASSGQIPAKLTNGGKREQNSGLTKWPNLKASEPVVNKEEGKDKYVAKAINTLDELKRFPLDEFIGSQTQNLAESIKKLVKNFGYHNVLFNLEQSPVYKLYLSTGMKLLDQNDGGDEQLNVKAENLLQKKDFERFVDLLRQIQAM